MNALELVREALSDEHAWVVGGAIRDRALGKGSSSDVDIVVDGDPAQAARAVAQAAKRVHVGASCFALSETFGAWRVVARDGSWQVDLEPLRGGSLEADLALRDFTVDAIAEPVAGGSPIDPLGGLDDLALGRLRMAGPGAFADDPVRVLRLARIAIERGFEVDESTARAARDGSALLHQVSAERVFFELCRIVEAPEAVRGFELLSDAGAVAAVLPELEAMRGVAQSRFHHLDVYDHTMAVLSQTVALEEDPGSIFGERWAEPLRAFLNEPLADSVRRGGALRWGALLHDVAKPQTRAVRAGDGRVTFFNHDRVGAEQAKAIMARLRSSERTRAHVAGLVANHLRLGFLVHEPMPLARADVYRYMRACEPGQVDVTLLSACDRMATRGDRAEEAISAHLTLALAMLEDAVAWREHGPPAPLLRGDELAGELGIERGPLLGELIEALSAAQYAGEVGTREHGIALARKLVSRMGASQ